MMSETWALIKKGIVSNVIIWDGGLPIDFGDDVIAVEYTEESPADIGYAYIDGKFIAPTPLDEEIAAQNADKIKNNMAIKDSLIAEAKSRIFVPQTKLLMGRALTDTEKAQLNAWLDYVDTLDEMDVRGKLDVVWPQQPD